MLPRRPVETNNGFLKYEDETTTNQPLNPSSRSYSQYNPLTGVINSRSVEAHARGSAESGMHIENTPMPGRVGNQFAINQGKVDFVANYCGTYSAFPSQMFDRRVEIMNTLYLGLRAYELSTDAKLKVTNDRGELIFPLSASNRRTEAEQRTMYFFQYLPFSSRCATVIQAVTDKHEAMVKAALEAEGNANPTQDAVRARMQSGQRPTRAEAAKLVPAVKQQSETGLPSAHFDTATFDPIRSDDLFNMCGAWRLGRVLDTKAAVHDRYAGGPRDTAFSCIVDVGVAWRSVFQVRFADGPLSQPTGFLLPGSQGGYVQRYQLDDDGKEDRTRPISNAPQAEKSGQQTPTCLANNLAPPLTSTIGPDFGRNMQAPRGPDEAAAAAERLERMAQERAELEAREQERAAVANTLIEQKAVAVVVKESAADKARADVEAILVKEEMADLFVTDQQFGVDPMQYVQAIVSNTTDVPAEPPGEQLLAFRTKYGGEKTTALWEEFKAYKQFLMNTSRNTNAKPETLAKARKDVEDGRLAWQEAATAEIKASVKYLNTLGEDGKYALATDVPSGFKETKERAVAAIKKFQGAVVNAQADIEALISEKPGDGTRTAYISERSKFLNRVNHFVNLFGVLTTALGVNQSSASAQGFAAENDPMAIDRAFSDAALFNQLMHLSALCDLHEQHFPLHDPLFVPPAPPPAPAPAPAPVAATPAAAVAKPPGKVVGKRGKSPVRPGRATATGAAASSSAAAPRPAAPAPSPVPAAAAGMSTTPLVPTAAPISTAADAAPRRRARDTGESVTNSLFANMFTAAAPTEATAEEPASPTPSSGSEGPTSGPRTFRRQR